MQITIDYTEDYINDNYTKDVYTDNFSEEDYPEIILKISFSVYFVIYHCYIIF